MKKYKHKQTGEVAELINGIYVPSKANLFFQFPPMFIENSNDWEEIKEPNYLITAFRSIETIPEIVKINPDGTFLSIVKLEDMLTGPNSVESNSWEIYSVKNSKGEEFTIGDKVYFQSTIKYPIGEIKSFKESVDYIHVITTEREGNLEFIKKPDGRPVFVSADGKEIYEGDMLYYVTWDFRIHHNTCNIYDGQNTDYKYFSTKQAAQEYIDNNMPKYSLSDIENSYIKAMKYEFNGLADILEELKELGK